MNRKSYSQILDDVANYQTPAHLDLAPTILTRIQKGKGSHMQPKTKLVSAVLLVVIAFVILFYTVPRVAAAIERWFGYVPGVGLVREGQIRILDEPVSVTREGITVTVEQVVLNQERTALVYSVEGIPSAALITQPDETICPYAVSLHLPDGSPLLATPNGLQSWSSGYQHRFDYPSLPTNVNDAKLKISCLFHTRSGAAPEGWEIPLRFVPAPAEMTAFPVIEITTPTTSAALVTPTASATEDTASASAALSLTLDRAVQMDDGYLLYATLHWEDTPFTSVDLIDPAETMNLVDSSGQEMLYEVHYDEQTGVNWDQRRTFFAIKTAPVQSTGPLTLALEAVSVELPANASFVFDPGSNPEPGQQWQPNVELSFGERRLRVRSITVEEGGYSFEMTSNTGILSAGVVDLEHDIISGYGGESGSNGQENIFFSGFYYADGLPEGPLTFTVGSIGVKHLQQLQVQWTPPAASTTLLPTQTAACLTAEAWQASLDQLPAIPAGLPGKVLVYGAADKNNPNGTWEMAITNLDGSQRQPIAGERGAISPDGARLAYSIFGAGIKIKNLASGEPSPVPGTGNGDFNPFWSPDGKRIVFNRGMGIFDLFIVNLDGTDLRQLTFGGVQEFPVGWLADGSLLYSVPGQEYEYTVYRLDLQSGESQVFSSENIQSISPDGQYLAIAEVTFGERWQVVISELDGGNRWSLADGNLSVLTPIWSPDGQWMLARVSNTGAESTMGALINLRTCEVIPLPNLQDEILAWIP